MLNIYLTFSIRYSFLRIVYFFIPSHKSVKLASQYPKLASLVQDEESITLAVNTEYVAFGEHKVLKNGDTVALIPPISGG